MKKNPSKVLPQNGDGTQDSNHVLEKQIADFITEHDCEVIEKEKLVAIYKNIYQSTDKEYALATLLFALQYTMQLKNYPSNGSESIAYQALGKSMGSMGDEIKRGIKLGLELRGRISKKSEHRKQASSRSPPSSKSTTVHPAPASRMP